ncbi:unnamed protein product [Rotaria magnacalcarata]|uniref:ABC transporter domain-containing protein n=1 Tax=Rotaria magnacalcarata TaxID=392030 RepID=A0A816XJX2_9BILA|nr:unnamed protein product [Rotaria magnacalcarata]
MRTPTIPKNSSPLSNGAIAAIVICSIIAGVVGIIGGYFLYRYRSKISKICREKLNLKAPAQKLKDDDDDEDEHRSSPRDLVMRRSNITRTRGPSKNSKGCGKSSLLDILAARKDPRGLSGRVLVDGLPLPSSFKYMVGYVIQDDIISGTLTVRENLIFSANVRLPTSVS